MNIMNLLLNNGKEKQRGKKLKFAQRVKKNHDVEHGF